MSLTANSSPESARRKFLMNSMQSCLESGNQTFLGSGGRNESKPIVRSNRRAENFS